MLPHCGSKYCSFSHLQEVSEDVVPWFLDAARGLLEAELPGGPEAALARALAKIAGHTQLRARSLLTAHEDFTTLQVISRAMCSICGEFPCS